MHYIGQNEHGMPMYEVTDEERTELLRMQPCLVYRGTEGYGLKCFGDRIGGPCLVTGSVFYPRGVQPPSPLQFPVFTVREQQMLGDALKMFVAKAGEAYLSQPAVAETLKELREKLGVE